MATTTANTVAEQQTLILGLADSHTLTSGNHSKNQTVHRSPGMTAMTNNYSDDSESTVFSSANKLPHRCQQDTGLSTTTKQHTHM